MYLDSCRHGVVKVPGDPGADGKATEISVYAYEVRAALWIFE
jgi:hypothetical protein